MEVNKRTIYDFFNQIGVNKYIDKYNLRAFVGENENLNLCNIYDLTIDGNRYTVTTVNGKIKVIYNYRLLKQSSVTSISILYEIVDRFFKIKIKSIDDSVSLFRNKILKKRMFDSNSTFSLYDVVTDYELENKSIVDVVILKDPVSNKNLKFCASDLEFIPINLSSIIKGYTKPKDRRLISGCKFLVKCNKFDRNVPLNSIGEVILEKLLATGERYYSLVRINGKEYKLILRKSKFKRIDNKTQPNVSKEEKKGIGKNSYNIPPIGAI